MSQGQPRYRLVRIYMTNGDTVSYVMKAEDHDKLVEDFTNYLDKGKDSAKPTVPLRGTYDAAPVGSDYTTKLVLVFELVMFLG